MTTPSPPTNLIVTDVTFNSAVVVYAPPSSGPPATSYMILYQPSGDLEYATVITDQLYCPLPNLTSSRSYTVTVRTVATDYVSTPSAPITFSTPGTLINSNGVTLPELNAALSTKLDLSGGTVATLTVTGNITIEGQISGNNLVAGPVGPKGDTGVQGIQGPLGPTGPIGLTGPKGDTGIQGIPGVVGPGGPGGPKGDTGPTGLPGMQGPVGPIGPAGAQGNAGVAGPVGPTGAMGNSGATGPQGIQGPQGVQGPTGSFDTSSGVNAGSSEIQTTGLIAGGSLQVSGNATFGSASINGSSIQRTGDAVNAGSNEIQTTGLMATGSLTVTNNASFGSASVNGSSVQRTGDPVNAGSQEIQTTGLGYFGSLTVSALSSLASLTVSGITTLTGALNAVVGTFTGLLTASGGLNVTGSTTLNGNVTLAGSNPYINSNVNTATISLGTNSQLIVTGIPGTAGVDYPGIVLQATANTGTQIGSPFVINTSGSPLVLSSTPATSVSTRAYQAASALYAVGTSIFTDWVTMLGNLSVSGNITSSSGTSTFSNIQTTNNGATNTFAGSITTSGGVGCAYLVANGGNSTIGGTTGFTGAVNLNAGCPLNLYPVSGTNYIQFLPPSSLSAIYVVSLPPKAGTVAMLSDITSSVANYRPVGYMTATMDSSGNVYTLQSVGGFAISGQTITFPSSYTGMTVHFFKMTISGLLQAAASTFASLGYVGAAGCSVTGMNSISYNNTGSASVSNQMCLTACSYVNISSGTTVPSLTFGATGVNAGTNVTVTIEIMS